ncbi:conserved Plasmodium protein, unknown function [Plasmodium chabaudi chabaudi]|uniref:MHD domain-containing protein n=1 Tax=Plasmodium chabaudi chabaudi TaxID=31271 RepID=A0A4V0K923_PLACU|nr:conserved Plasmodium protein, unknown function [Plasmodium chabaudi chabaudi]VTZ69112.1 conserved Plasmodium protein, unknown function [Plasmodium chabaudi chabaudi]|eukprot:XP_016653947.1 conserved Plasmodium protein, unknown function [Plasmodium chabaudi chabaudi]
MNNGIRALYLFNSSTTGPNLIYTKTFLNIEVCARSLQNVDYINILKLKNIEHLIKSQIIDKENENIWTYDNFLELNKTISCYKIHIKNKILYPFLLGKKRKFIVVILLLIDNTNNKTNIGVIKNNSIKLFYYNFINDLLNYVKNITIKYDHHFCTNDSYIIHKLKSKLDYYIANTIPYGRVINLNNFFNYMKTDMYKSEDILDNNISIFYDYLYLTNNKNLIINENKLNDIKNYFIRKDSNNIDAKKNIKIDNPSPTSFVPKLRDITQYVYTSTNLQDKNNKEEIVNINKQNGEQSHNLLSNISNNVLYINTKPPFVNYKNVVLIDDETKYNFFKLLQNFFNTINKKNDLSDNNRINYFYSLYLFFFYNYSIYFEKNKKILINKLETHEHSKNNKENIQIYTPIYLYERNARTTPFITIKEEITCFITSSQNNDTKIKGDIILKHEEDKCLNINMVVELNSEDCDIYAGNFAILEKRGKSLKIKYPCKHPNNNIITYYYKNLPSPFCGSYKTKMLNEKSLEINITLQRNNHLAYSQMKQKGDEYLFFRLPFPFDIIDHTLKCNFGKIQFDNKKEIKWIFPNFARESPAVLNGTIQASYTEKMLKQLAGEIHIFFKSNYSKTKIVHANTQFSADYILQSKNLIMLSS